MLGATIGAYRVLAKIGEGGMGTVYVGEHTLLGRRAAIKVLRSEMSAKESIVMRFFNEARVITSISDPGIVQVFDYGVHEGSAYIVMELLEGETLHARLKRLGRLPASEVLRLGRYIATTLAAAHAKNVVHRDLKPDNIFLIGDPAVTGGERTKILDFGIAKLLQSDEETDNHNTQTGMLMGTPMYMSPEQCRGAGEVDHRSDIYSLGCVLFRMLAGRPPFDRRGSGEIIASHLKEAPPLIASYVDDVSPAVEHVVQQCLAKDPAHRPQTALELTGLLSAIETGAPFTPVPRIPTPVPGEHEALTVQVSPAQALVEAATPTTMQGASGQASRPVMPRKRSVGVLAWIVGCLAVGGGIAVVTEMQSEDEPIRAPAPATEPMPAPSAAPVVVEPPPAPPPEPEPPKPESESAPEPEPAQVAAPLPPPKPAPVAKKVTPKPKRVTPKPKPATKPAPAKIEEPKPKPRIDRAD